MKLLKLLRTIIESRTYGILTIAAAALRAAYFVKGGRP